MDSTTHDFVIFADRLLRSLIMTIFDYFFHNLRECIGSENAIDNLYTCKAKVKEFKKLIPNAYFSQTENDANFPKGCYFYVDEFLVSNFGAYYFNEHDTGNSNNKARHICKVEGKK